MQAVGKGQSDAGDVTQGEKSGIVAQNEFDPPQMLLTHFSFGPHSLEYLFRLCATDDWLLGLYSGCHLA